MSHAETLPLTELRLAVSILVHAMVDDPTAAKISIEDVQGGKCFRIQVAQTDVGKLIGANGRTARGLRILLHAAGMKYGQMLTVDIDG